MTQSLNQPRVLLISIGSFGQKYLELLTRENAEAQVAGIVDVAPGLEEKFPVIGERHIPLYRRLEDFFSAHSADLAVICSPIHLHTRMAAACLERGVPVLCEKPLCLTEEETNLLAETARKTGKFLAIGWQLNYDPAVLALKRDILSGRFGAPLRFRCVHAMRRGEKYYARANWAGRISLDGMEVFDGPFMNACAHNFQMMTFLLGGAMNASAQIKAGEGELYRGNPGVENYDIAALRFITEDGVPILYYTAHPLKTKNLGQTGLAEFERATVSWGKGQPYRAVTREGEEIIYGIDKSDVIANKLHETLACVKNGGEPLCGPLVGLPHLKAVRMAQEWPVKNIPADHVDWLEEDGDRIPCVRNLEDVFLQSAEKWALPRETGLSL